jgi:DNA-binding transcriptional LysR family regulator
MKRDLPPLDLLKSFEASARHLSFTKAGEELHLSQSAVSRQIQLLEGELGIALFHRRTRALLLTDAGQSYYREVAPLLQKLREATAKLGQSQHDGVVTVTTTMTFASVWLVPRLSDFQRRYPHIAVHVAADNNMRDLRTSGLDVSIRYCTRQMAGEGATRLFGERVAPVCSPALLARSACSAPDHLQRFALLHFEDPQGRGPWLSWDVWFEVMGIPRVQGKASSRFSHYDQLLHAAVAGQGIALGRFPLVEELIRGGKLVTPLKSRRYSMDAMNRAYWLLLSPTGAKRPNVQIFGRWLREQVETDNLQN